MLKLLGFGLIGFFAQLIDGALGMSYGVTSTTLLLTAGVAPAVASASVHLAEIGTTLASGTAHWKLGNVEWPVIIKLAVPGFFGAFLGAVVLSSLSAETAAPVISGILILLGVYVLFKFARNKPDAEGQPKPEKRIRGIFLAPLGLFAGAMDALGGGGWGPIGTPTLLSSTDMEPRKVVGSVDTSEFLVAIGASLGFLVGLGGEAINYGWVGALLVGGLFAAPLAAWIVKKLPPRILGLSVGTLIIVTNSQNIAETAGVSDDASSAIYLVFGVAWLIFMATLLLRERRASLEPEMA